MKFLRRIFCRRTLLSIVEDELYATKVAALQAAIVLENNHSYTDMLNRRAARLKETRDQLKADADLPR